MVTIVSVPPTSSAAVAPAVVAGDLALLVVRDFPIVPIVLSVIVMVLLISAAITVSVLLFTAAFPILALFVVVTVVAAILRPFFAAMVFPVVFTAFVAIVTSIVIVTSVVVIMAPLQLMRPTIHVAGSVALFFVVTAVALSGLRLIADDDVAES